MSREPTDSNESKHDEASGFESRGYQLEMLAESLARNVLVVMPTGSGKTHIAVLRLKLEAQTQSSKISWFLAPKVYLCQQQEKVISSVVPGPVVLVTGQLHPDQWKDPQLWRSIIQKNRIIVSTPQVLLDALHHGYIVLGRDVGLLVFDEVHHAQGDNDPYNQIMKNFYLNNVSRKSGPGPCEESVVSPGSKVEVVRPVVLGLTATAVYDHPRELENLEKVMDAVVLAPLKHADELAEHVHRPNMNYAIYPPSIDVCSTNLESLRHVVERLDIEQDPQIVSLRMILGNLTNKETPEAIKLGQDLESLRSTGSTFVHKGLRSLVETGHGIRDEVGAWAADWFIYEMVLRLQQRPKFNDWVSTLDWKRDETDYLKSILDQLVLTEPSYEDADIEEDCSEKTKTLIQCLLHQKEHSQSLEETFSGMIFVEKRVTVAALSQVLKYHSSTRDLFKIGYLVGVAVGAATREDRKLADIFHMLFPNSRSEALTLFCQGTKDLLISTAVGEEGLDIPSCCSVIRWDLPTNMVSFIQSRGRARKKDSIFTLMILQGDVQGEANTRHWDKINKLLEREKELEARTKNLNPSEVSDIPMDENDKPDDQMIFRVDSTGASLTMSSAVSHLSHFCAVIPGSIHLNNRPIYEVEPAPSFPSAFLAVHPYQGPFGATVTLPRSLPISQRQFGVERIYGTKNQAKQAAAFEAYIWLYEHGLLNDHLLPLSSVMEPEKEEELLNLLSTAVGKRAGTVGVGGQMNPWLPDPLRLQDGWYCSEMQIGDLPPLKIFTKRQAEEWDVEGGPRLHYPPLGCQLPVSMRRSEFLPDSSSPLLSSAREFTRRIFWNLYPQHMQRDDTNFPYLFFPVEEQYRDSIWDGYQAWADDHNERGGYKDFDVTLANGEAFAKHFNYPQNIVSVRHTFKNGKPYKFVRWQRDPITEEEETRVKKRYQRQHPDFQIRYPLLAVENFPPREYFVVPPINRSTQQKDLKLTYLAPQHSAISISSPNEIHLGTLLPSILRSIAVSTTIGAMRQSLWSSCPALADIPTSLLQPALLCTTAQERENYQRLEQLGDCVLKYTTSLQLLAEYPFWHEGYLSQKAQHIISNFNLAKQSFEKNVFLYIIRDRLLLRKWKPESLSKLEDEVHMNDEKNMSKEALSTKTLGDVVESLIGAAYLHGGVDLSSKMCAFFDLGVPWESVASRVKTLLDRVDANEVRTPTQVPYVEAILGYTFRRKTILTEALTHASFMGQSESSSYERLEFLGDTVIDMMIVPYLYNAQGQQFSPGQVSLRKSALINASTLGYFCLGAHADIESSVPQRQADGSYGISTESKPVYLWQCVIHTSPQILDDQRSAFERFEQNRSEIAEAFESGEVFPWGALVRIQAPKFFCDVFESVIGAVYLDSEGNLEVVQNVLSRLGWYRLLERVAKDNLGIEHPVSQLYIRAAKNKKKKVVEYEMQVDEKIGMITCCVKIDGEEYASVSTLFKGNSSRAEVKLAAAELALRKLGSQSQEANKRPTSPPEMN